MSKEVQASMGKANEAAAGQCHVGHCGLHVLRLRLDGLFLQEDNKFKRTCVLAD